MATAAAQPLIAPDHVPPDLVWDHDINAFAAEYRDPFLGVARMHEGPDIVWATGAHRGRPGWVLTRYAHIQEAFMDARRFSSSQNGDVAELLGVDWHLNPLEIDPPAHMAYRQILQPYFLPSAVNTLEPMVREVCTSLIAAFEDKGGCEFIGDFASLFPSYIFLELMGMPRDLVGQFLHLEDTYMRGPSIKARVGALREILHYLEGYAKERRRNPGSDLVSTIVTAEIDGRRLTEGEAMGMCMVLYLGGLDTVMSSLGWYFRHLAQDQDLLARLRDDPDAIPGAVDDLLRAYGVTGTIRTATEDFTFHGAPIRAGDTVVVPTYLAGRDPQQYSNPHSVDPDRKARHLTLATGVHNCLGIHLAKREIKVVLEAFLTRFRNIRIPQGEEAVWHTNGVWGVSRLPLVWDR